MGLIEGVEAGSTCENSRTCRTCGTCGTSWTSGTCGACGTCESCGICGACGTCAIGLSACGLGRIISTWHAHCMARTLQCPGAWCWRESQRRDREIGPDRSGCLVVMLQGAVKETPVEATLVRGVPFSIPRTWLRKMALPPDHTIFCSSTVSVRAGGSFLLFLVPAVAFTGLLVPPLPPAGRAHGSIGEHEHPRAPCALHR